MDKREIEDEIDILLDMRENFMIYLKVSEVMKRNYLILKNIWIIIL